MNDRQDMRQTQDMQAMARETDMSRNMNTTENSGGINSNNNSGGSTSSGTSFGGMNPRVAVLAGVAAVAAIAGAAAAVGAGRLDRIDSASDAPQIVAGIALFASGILAAVVCAARTRIEAQRDEIEVLSERIALQSALDADGARELQPAWHRDPDFAAHFELRESER